MAEILIGNIKGPQGAKGDKGDKGDTGPQGPAGPQGATGPMPALVNGFTTTEAGIAALDAAAGKTLKDEVTQLNSDMQNCYQLSGGIYIPENADMKSSQYLIPGNYYCNSVNVALTLSNCPFKSAFLLKVEWSVGSNAKYIRQTFIQYDNNRTISRVYFDNEAVWQDETQFITNADIQTEYNVANSNVVFRCEATDGSAIQLAATATQLQLQKRTSATGSWEIVWAK